jgi:hypothetical protein
MACSNAIKFVSKYVLAYNNGALSRVNIDDDDGTLADCESVLRPNPKLAVTYCNQGLAHNNSEEHENAIRSYTNSIDLGLNIK